MEYAVGVHVIVERDLRMPLHGHQELLALRHLIGFDEALGRLGARHPAAGEAVDAPVAYTHLDVYKRQVLRVVCVYRYLPGPIRQR